MFLVDSHCHLDCLDYEKKHESVDDVMQKAAQRDVKYALAVATTLPGYTKMRELIGERPDVAFSCGIHPLNLDEPYDFTQLRELAADKRVVALGETGLDYYYQKENAALQREVFREHIRIGRELNKPVIVHTRMPVRIPWRLSAKNRPGSAAACYTALPKTKRRHQRCWMKVFISPFPAS